MTEPSEELMDVVFAGLDHGIDSVRGGGPLVPFVIVEHEGDRKLQRFVVGDPFELEESVAQATLYARETAGQSGDRLVLVYDAYLRMNDDRFDAIYAEGVEDGNLIAIIAQRYRPKGRIRGLETIGNAQGLPPDMSRFAG
jgi:hypothetical protein